MAVSTANQVAFEFSVKMVSAAKMVEDGWEQENEWGGERIYFEIDLKEDEQREDEVGEVKHDIMYAVFSHPKLMPPVASQALMESLRGDGDVVALEWVVTQYYHELRIQSQGWEAVRNTWLTYVVMEVQEGNTKFRKLKGELGEW